MVTETYPLGAAALHPDWPQARFNVSGMFAHNPLFIQFCDSCVQGFDCIAPVESFHGAPAVPWNSGRSSRVQFNDSQFDSTLKCLYARNIGFVATFSSHILNNDDLSNPLGNHLLDCINRRADLNGVVVASDLLSDYIARKYPGIRQIASIIKVTLDGGRGKPEYYRSLGSRFHRYVVHPDDCRDLKLLDQLDREKAEIIVNENCVANCTNRVRHYDAFAKFQKSFGSASLDEQQRCQQQVNRVGEDCRSPIHLGRLANHQRSCNLTRPELKAIYDMGFRHFKLQGRADDPFLYAYDITRFMLEPDIAAPLVLKSLVIWLSKVMMRSA